MTVHAPVLGSQHSPVQGTGPQTEVLGEIAPPEARQTSGSVMMHATGQQQGVMVGKLQGALLHGTLGRCVPPVVKQTLAEVTMHPPEGVQHAPKISFWQRPGWHVVAGPYHVPPCAKHRQSSMVWHVPSGRQHAFPPCAAAGCAESSSASRRLRQQANGSTSRVRVFMVGSLEVGGARWKGLRGKGTPIGVIRWLAKRGGRSCSFGPGGE